MNDRAPIRDRTLALRILVPRLADRLREKMKELEDVVAEQKSMSGGGTPSKSQGSSAGGGSSSSAPDSYWDLDGVSCEPTAARNRTLWNFHCDGATYPAKLVNLPCPVEVHKTFDHANYYKCQDVAQLLIVYEDEFALEEADEKPLDGFESYYHSGLTPPMKRVVERRFDAREQKAVAPPRAAVADVEEEILQLMKQLQKDEKGSAAANKRNKLPSLASTTKILEEVEEVVVHYEPWMDDGGKQPDGVEFDIDDPLATTHPEIFLSPLQIRELQEQEEEAQKKKLAAQEKKDMARREKKAREEKKKKDAAAAAAAAENKPKKKGIPSRKKQQQQQQEAEEAAAQNNAAVDDSNDIELAAKAAMSADDILGDLGDGDFLDFDLEEDDLGGLGI